VVLIAVARKILSIADAVVRSGRPWVSEDGDGPLRDAICSPIPHFGP
jgi:hypothetical protein